MAKKAGSQKGELREPARQSVRRRAVRRPRSMPKTTSMDAIANSFTATPRPTPSCHRQEAVWQR